MKFTKNFIGYEKPNTTFIKDGIYYKYNGLGHRCKNIDDIDLDNYILFAGCSHTEGEGLQIEETYPFLTAKLLECDYYNLALSASGFDVLFYNVMGWLNTYKKPKLVVLQYPDQTRFSTIFTNNALIVPYGPWRSDKEDSEFLVKANDTGMFKFRNFTMVSLLNQYIDVPKVKLVFGSTKSYDSECIRIDKLDYAVDNMHYGAETHQMCAEMIIDEYNRKKI